MTFNPEPVELVMFDLFGTLFDLSGPALSADIAAYAAHIRKEPWQPFKPPSSWADLKPFDDVQEGLEIIDDRCSIGILSNCPYPLAVWLTRDMPVDVIFQLAAARVFKPRPAAYQVPIDVYAGAIKPDQMLMVTANEKFGDLQGARNAGMQSCLIRDDKIPDLFALGRLLSAS